MKTLLRHVSDPPAPPSTRTEIAVPKPLEDAILSCLAKSPGDRPANADAFGALLSGPWVPPWTPRDADAWWAQHMPAVHPTR